MREVARPLAELRLQAEAAARAEDWPALLALADRLRAEDPDYWPHLWAPLAAVATQVSGGDGGALLAEAVAGGFRQPALLPEVAEHLGSHPRWAELAAAMAAPAPPPAYEVTRWPGIDYGPALVLDRLAPAREDELRDRLPAPARTAWGTATALLEWATTRWEHANDHVTSEDAVEVLDRAAAGERFACVEYSILLSQALNAVGIPARRLDLRAADHHVGFGRGHVVSEAWIDELGAWVVLDGQNGAWWGTPERPLGVRELQDRFAAGDPRPAMVTTAREVAPERQDEWWSYFASATASGLGWGSSVVPVFQGQPVTQRLAVGPGAPTHPDLTQLETGTLDAGTAPAVVLRPTHPYASGVSVSGAELPLDNGAATYDLGALAAGDHALEVRVRTAYGLLAPQPLTVVVRT